MATEQNIIGLLGECRKNFPYYSMDGRGMHEKTGMARSRLPVAHRKRKQRKTLDGAKLVKGFMKILKKQGLYFLISHFISCSSLSKTGAVKNSLSVISRPSQSFLMVVMEISRRFGSSILYTVDGVTPERTASSLIRISRWKQSSRKRCATASLTIITFITCER